jgi:hypothetical protein
MRLYRIAFLAMLFALPAGAGAADLGPGVSYPGPCAAPVYASVPQALDAGVPDQASLNSLRIDVQHRYSHAIELSQSEAIVFNPGSVYTWAEATKLSCGKAIGYLASNEVNALQLNECDCFYRRMVSLMR